MRAMESKSRRQTYHTRLAADASRLPEAASHAHRTLISVDGDEAPRFRQRLWQKDNFHFSACRAVRKPILNDE